MRPGLLSSVGVALAALVGGWLIPWTRATRIYPCGEHSRIPYPMVDVSCIVGFECHEIDLLYEVHPTDSTPGVRKAANDRRSSSTLTAVKNSNRQQQHLDSESDGNVFKFRSSNSNNNNNNRHRNSNNYYRNAISLAPNSNIRIPHRLVLPEEMPRHFMLSSRLKSESPLGGYLFAVLDSSDTVIQLGMYMHPVDNFKQNITIYYSDTRNTRNNQIAKFVIDDFTGSWIW
ncbi:uncharacterized protein LOC111254239 [Varroa destructor]|uniref:Uncharacterized protein n=1 Tax=Varroa destructor TaxID=109461 RepID=A0A7M7KW79_VARDE|nr:uncharacterized protein LOC111254239 [Varroa destructor]